MHRPLTRVSTSWQTCWQSQSRSGACCWEMPKCFVSEITPGFLERYRVQKQQVPPRQTGETIAVHSTKEEQPCTHAEFDVQLTHPSSMSVNAVCGSTPRQTQSGTG